MGENYEILQFWRNFEIEIFTSEMTFPASILLKFHQIAALRAMFQLIGYAGALALCHVYTYDVIMFYGVGRCRARYVLLYH